MSVVHVAHRNDAKSAWINLEIGRSSKMTIRRENQRGSFEHNSRGTSGHMTQRRIPLILKGKKKTTTIRCLIQRRNWWIVWY
jgi:hypothetical protein